MAASAAIAAFGLVFQRSTDGSVYTTIGEVVDPTPPPLTGETTDVTHEESPGGFREYLATLRDAGEPTFTINFDPSGATHAAHTSLLTDLVNGTLQYWKVVYPGSVASWSFRGIVTSFEPEAPMDGALRASVTIRTSGQPTLTE